MVTTFGFDWACLSYKVQQEILSDKSAKETALKTFKWGISLASSHFPLNCSKLTYDLKNGIVVIDLYGEITINMFWLIN